jgi:hypothetical protein
VWRLPIADVGPHYCIILTRDDLENSVTFAIITHSRPQIVKYPILSVEEYLPSLAGVCDGYVPCDALFSRLRRLCTDAYYLAKLSDSDLGVVEDAVRYALDL